MASIGVDISFQVPGGVIEETDDYVISKSSWGVVSKNMKHTTSAPQHIDFLVKDRKSWEENKWRLAYNESRVNFEQALATFKNAQESGIFLNYGGAGLGFDIWQNVASGKNWHSWAVSMCERWLTQIRTSYQKRYEIKLPLPNRTEDISSIPTTQFPTTSAFSSTSR